MFDFESVEKSDEDLKQAVINRCDMLKEKAVNLNIRDWSEFKIEMDALSDEMCAISRLLEARRLLLKEKQNEAETFIELF
jgi:hypothetical protein